MVFIPSLFFAKYTSICLNSIVLPYGRDQRSDPLQSLSYIQYFLGITFYSVSQNSDCLLKQV